MNKNLLRLLWEKFNLKVSLCESVRTSARLQKKLDPKDPTVDSRAMDYQDGYIQAWKEAADELGKFIRP